MRESNQMNENQLKKYIKIILESEEKMLHEQYAAWSPDELFNGLIAPWLDVLKVVKLESQRLLNTTLFFLRTLITFNADKLQNLRANHKDRIEKINREVEGLIDKKTAYAVALAMNPAAFIALRAADSNFRLGVIDYFRGAGFGDLLPSEMDSPDSNREKLDRAREEQGLVMKTIRGLNNLFLAGHAPHGTILLEQQEEEDENKEEIPIEDVDLSLPAMENFIEASGIFKNVEIEKSDLENQAKNFLEATNTAFQFVNILSEVRSVRTSDNYISLLEKLNRISEDVKILSKSEIEDSISKDVESLMKNEEAIKQASLIYLNKRGISNPSEEEIFQVSENKIAEEMKEIAFGNVVGRLFGETSEAIAGIYDSHEKVYDDLWSGVETAEPEIKKIIVDSQYGKDLIKAKSNLDKIKNIENQLKP